MRSCRRLINVTQPSSSTLPEASPLGWHEHALLEKAIRHGSGQFYLHLTCERSLTSLSLVVCVCV